MVRLLAIVGGGLCAVRSLMHLQAGMQGASGVSFHAHEVQAIRMARWAASRPTWWRAGIDDAFARVRTPVQSIDDAFARVQTPVQGHHCCLTRV